MISRKPLSLLFVSLFGISNLFAQSLFVINDGSYNAGTGAFTRAGVGSDSYQGVVTNIAPVTLTNVGDFLNISFTWSGGASNNSGQNVVFGFFNGDTVTANGQTSITDDWEGYFTAIGARTGDSAANGAIGVYRQGSGDQPLIDRVNWTGGTSNANVNGAGGNVGSGGLRAGFNHPVSSQTINYRIELISDTQLRTTVIYQTGRQDGTHSATLGGIPYSMSVNSGISTVTATYNVSDGPTTISGLTFAARQNFNLSNITVTAIPEPSTYAVIFGFLALGLIVLRRRRQA